MLANFQRGRFGLGLLTLRVTVGISVILLGSAEMSSGSVNILSLAAIVLAILITVGLFTSLSSAIVALLICALCLVSHPDPIISVTIAALCVSLSMTGAGAYSFDGLLRGRRRIFVPEP